MKLRRSISPHQLLFALLAGLCLLLSGTPGIAQDQIVLRDGRKQDGKILGVSYPNVQIQVGAGKIGINIQQIASIQMAVPPQVAVAQAAYAAGENAKALAAAKAVVDQFNGLPLPWAQQTTELLGNLYLDMDKTREAEETFALLQKGYGAQGGLVGMARLAVKKKDYTAAREKLEPIISAALKDRNVPAGMGPTYSWAFLTMGQVNEAENDYPAALENYLRTVTLYPQSEKAVQLAREHADALRKEHNVTVP